MAVTKIITILLIAPMSLFSQNKIRADIGASLLHSVGKDQFETYNSVINRFSFEHYSKKKFRHPYFNVMARIAFAFLPKLQLGLQSGIYVHYLEGYPSPERSTTLSIPLQLTGRYSIYNSGKNSLGIDLSAGLIFFNIRVGNLENHKNGNLFTGAIFYSINEQSIIKLGLEEQIDHVSDNVQAWGAGYQPEVFKYNIKRSALFLSYSVIAK